LSIALSKNPQQRFGRCREFANALNEQLTGGSISNRETEADITLVSHTAGSLSRQLLPDRASRILASDW